MAYDFQAGTHQILYGNPSYLNDLSSFTYACWLQQDNAGGGGFGRIFSKDEKKTLNSFDFGSPANTFSGLITAATNHFKTAPDQSLQNNSTVWAHVAFSWDGNFTNAASVLYKDGAPATPYNNESPGSSPVTSDAAGGLAIGNRPSGTLNRGFDGRLAELAVWNVVLTQEEIKSLAKGFLPHRVRPQSLVFFVRCLRTANEIRNGTTSTVSGVAPAGYHPRVY